MFAVLDRVMDAVAANGIRPDLSQACHDAPGAADVGVLGPALFDSATRSIPGVLTGQPSGYGSLWAPLHRALGDDIQPGQRGLISITEQMTCWTKAKSIADEEDLGALAALQPQVANLPQLLNDLPTILNTTPDVAKQVMASSALPVAKVQQSTTHAWRGARCNRRPMTPTSTPLTNPTLKPTELSNRKTCHV